MFEALVRSLPYIFYLPFVWWLGNQFCRWIIKKSGVSRTMGTSVSSDSLGGNAGRYIGLFERLLISVGVIFQSWEILAVVVALKTVARYKELDQQMNAEYFLIGSLASILWAIVLTIALIVYDHGHCGFSLLPTGL